MMGDESQIDSTDARSLRPLDRAAKKSHEIVDICMSGMCTVIADVIFAQPMPDTIENGENQNVHVTEHRMSVTIVSYAEGDHSNLHFCGVIILFISVPGLLFLARSVAISFS